jgi:hypothetical protein
MCTDYAVCRTQRCDAISNGYGRYRGHRTDHHSHPSDPRDIDAANDVQKAVRMSASEGSHRHVSIPQHDAG